MKIKLKFSADLSLCEQWVEIGSRVAREDFIPSARNPFRFNPVDTKLTKTTRNESQRVILVEIRENNERFDIWEENILHQKPLSNSEVLTVLADIILQSAKKFYLLTLYGVGLREK